jgi:hypothetical protein
LDITLGTLRILIVSKGLQESLSVGRVPLVLASVDYYWPIFKEASSFSHLVGEGIKGNPDEIDEDELRDRA